MYLFEVDGLEEEKEGDEEEKDGLEEEKEGDEEEKDGKLPPDIDDDVCCGGGKIAYIPIVPFPVSRLDNCRCASDK
jgi:hypothetical protein